MAEWSITVGNDPFTGRPAPKLNIGAQSFYISIPELGEYPHIDSPRWGPQQYAGWYADQLTKAMERIAPSHELGGKMDEEVSIGQEILEGRDMVFRQDQHADYYDSKGNGYVATVFSDLCIGDVVEVWSSAGERYREGVVSILYSNLSISVLVKNDDSSWHVYVKRDRVSDINYVRIKTFENES